MCRRLGLKSHTCQSRSSSAQSPKILLGVGLGNLADLESVHDRILFRK